VTSDYSGQYESQLHARQTLACVFTVSGGANTVYFWRLQNHLS
jgi:hypothetical protein